MSEPKKVVSAIIQARLTSTRFPNKVLTKLGESTIIDHILTRLRRCKNLDKIVVAIPDTEANDKLNKYLSDFLVYRGDENDVMGRMIGVSKHYKIDHFVRICADSPFILPWAIDYSVDVYRKDDYDYLKTEGLVKGQNVEVVNAKTLEKYHQYASDEQKEHVTLYFEENYRMFNAGVINIKQLCVDTPEDMAELGPMVHYYD